MKAPSVLSRRAAGETLLPSRDRRAERPWVGVLILRATLLAYPELAPELVEHLERRGFGASLTLLRGEADAGAALLEAARRGTAAVLAAALPSAEAIAATQRSGVPVVLYNCFHPSSRHNAITCDHAEAGEALAAALAAAGHRRFGLILPPEDSFVGAQRMDGVRRALALAGGRQIASARGDYSYESGREALDRVFAALKPRPTAVVAANDAMALGALDQARSLGARVPRDLSVAGFDGSAATRWLSHELTTMQQPLSRMAEAAADLVARVVSDPARPAETRLFAAIFCPGGTARLEAAAASPAPSARARLASAAERPA